MDKLFPNSLDFEDRLFPPKITLRIKGKLLLMDRPWIMGILNITPDSFYSGSRFSESVEQIKLIAEKMVIEGADILDVGGYSSRPGADEVSVDEELSRVLPAIEVIKKNNPEILISIDTFRAEVAQEAVRAGADIINDISSGDLDRDMINTVAGLGVPYIAMHMRGNPKNMQQKTNYTDVLLEIVSFFAKKLEIFTKAGIKDVILDPGFGFAKTLEQNYWILKNLSYFKIIQAPILVGISRKSMIYKKLDLTPEESLNATTALHMAALVNGAGILRVHDVKEAKQTVLLYNQLYS
jgi:dihydropteroate synthase